MYKVCIVEENPLIRSVLKMILNDREFQFEKDCEVSELCLSFSRDCISECTHIEPCFNLLILDNCERESRSIEFLKFVDKNQCACIHSFKVLYVCGRLSKEDIELMNKLHVRIIEKQNAAVDVLPFVEEYKEWYLLKEANPNSSS